MKHLQASLYIGIALLSAAIASDVTFAAEQRMGRYTVIRSGPETHETQPLSALKLLRFPAYIQDVYTAITHLMQKTGYTLRMDAATEVLFRNLHLPQVHREIGPISIINALHTLAGPAWQISVDEKLREVSIVGQPHHMASAHGVKQVVSSKQNIGSLEEAVIAHHSQITLKSLVETLVPFGWQVSYEVPHSKTTQLIAFHAETTRRRALEQLFSELDLVGTFYPGQGLLLVRKMDL